MNKKLLLSALLCMLAATPLFSMRVVHSNLYLDLDQNVIVPMQKIQSITIPLQEDSIAYVNNTSKWSALAGACAGLGLGGYYVLQNQGHEILQQQTELFRKIAIPTVSTIITGGAGYCIGNFCATRNTQEKIDERKANSAINKHNAMIEKSNAVKLNEESRNLLNNLPFDGRSDDDRLTIYNNIHTGEDRPMHINKPVYPIHERTAWIADIASKLRAEQTAFNNLGNLPDIFASSPFLENHRAKAATMNNNKQHVQAMNNIISYKKIYNWVNYVEQQAPEYKLATLQKSLTQTQADLEQQEKSIRYDLARLAALLHCNFSHISLCDGIIQYLSSNWSTNYPNTADGNKARNADIASTKNHISHKTQNYQSKINEYNLQVIDHNKVIVQVPQNIKTFIVNKGGSANDLDGRRANPNLLQYNNYLNHSNDSLIINWINSCFDN